MNKRLHYQYSISRATELDPEVLNFYAKKLLLPGWAGEVNHAEASYIARCLVDNPRLRQTWQIAQFTRRRKGVTAAIVKRVARTWAGMPL
jgi:hypothetical protein